MSSLFFDIDTDQLKVLQAELSLTENQARYSLSRALRLTAASLRKLALKGFKSELDVKKVAWLRRRLREVKFRNTSIAGTKLWYGLNDVPISTVKGRVSKTSTGASFTGKAGSASFENAFVTTSRKGYGRTILQRIGKKAFPLREAELPIKDKMDVYIEDRVFDQVEDILWKHLSREMKARSRFGVGWK